MMKLQQEYYDNDKFATTIAATAFAIHLFEETQRKKQQGSNMITISRQKTKKEEEPIRPTKSTSLMKPSGQDRRASSFLRGVSFSYLDNEQMQRGKVRKERKTETKADAWEKAQMDKIKKRYEKLESRIVAWENESKMRTKLQQEKAKNELELRKTRNQQHYNMKVARIEHIVEGARTQAKEKRKNEELLAKKKAEKIRAARKTPLICCLCY